MIPIVDGFPLTSLPRYISANRKHLIHQCLLSGAILFRNFHVPAHSFEGAVDAFDMQKLEMLGSAAPRTRVSNTVYTANDSPPSERIPFHHEMAQTKNPPSHIFFYCHTPSLLGGSTPLLDSRKVCAFVKKEFPEEYLRLAQGVYYQRILPEFDDSSSPIGRGWRSTFLCDTKEDINSFLSKTDMTFKWLENDNLFTRTSITPVFSKIGSTSTFFNSIIAVYNGWNDERNDGKASIVDIDDKPLNSDFMDALNTFADEQKVEFEWQQEDVLMIDNRVTMHSRSPFIPPRRLYASIRNLRD
jgi:hypothetical protein